MVSMSQKHRSTAGGEAEPDGGRLAASSRIQRHSLFIREYLIDRNATQAAIRAGYNPKTAYAQGHRLLKNAEIAAQIEAATTALMESLEVTKERITRELAAIAFSDIRDFLAWGPDETTITDPVTGTVIGRSPGVTVTSSSRLDEAAARAISEISETRQGLKLKLHNKLLALKLLGLELGMFKERTDVDFASPLHAIVEAVQREASPLPINDPNAGRVVR
jgi:phage terminase small subunit